MKAAVFKGPFEVVVEEALNPNPSAGKVLIRVEACGICG